MLLASIISLLMVWCCAARISSEKFSCLRNGACPDECPRGFNGDSNCSSCTDDRLSISSNCIKCKDCHGDCLMGNFTLSVLFHSYLNPESLCGECHLPEYGEGPVCCDTFNQTENCPRNCSFRLVLSVEAHGEPLQYIEFPALPPDFGSDNIPSFPIGPDSFHISNYSNPFTVQLNTWTGRFQMYIVVYDVYRVSGVSLGRFAIDRFAINVTLDGIPSNLLRHTYHGIYGVSQLDLSFKIQSDNYYNPSCTTTQGRGTRPNTLVVSSPTTTTSNTVENGLLEAILPSPNSVPVTNSTVGNSDDDCVALMNSYRVLLVLTIVLPIVAVIATIIVMTNVIFYRRRYDLTRKENHSLRMASLSSSKDQYDPKSNFKSISDNSQAGDLLCNCDVNPSYDTVKPTTNPSYAIVKSATNGSDMENSSYYDTV